MITWFQVGIELQKRANRDGFIMFSVKGKSSEEMNARNRQINEGWKAGLEVGKPS